jgi:Flp pilus assembly protein TadG
MGFDSEGAHPRRTWRRRVSPAAQDGQAMTELAIALPVLCLLIFGVIQFGILFNHYLTLTDAARAGARKGAVSRNASSPESDTATQVRQSASDLDQTELEVDVASSWEQGENVTVTASYPYEVDLLGFVVASGTLETTVTERVE